MKTTLILLSFLVSNCASLSSKSKTLDLKNADELKREIVAANQMNLNFPDKKLAGGAGFKCTPSKVAPKQAVILLNLDNEIFNQKDFCRKNPLALMLMGDGLNYEVLALNRPGFESGGIIGLDFNGPDTSAQLDSLVKSIKSEPIVGIWAAGGATISAIELARKLTSIEWLALGSGFYDMDLFTREVSSDYGKQVSAFMAKTKDPSKFQEERSPAWNPSGLPKTVYFYHGKKDEQIPWTFSKSFHDTLAAEEKSTKEYFVDDITHSISMAQHAVFLEGLLQP